MKDFQRSKLYKWEREQWWWVDDCVLTIEEMHVWSKRLIGRNVIIKHGGGSKSGSAYGKHIIRMPRFTRNLPYLCHELAHLETDDYHGPCFVEKYIALLVNAGVTNSKMATTMSAIDHGLEVKTS